MEYREFEDLMASQMGDPIDTDGLKYYFKKFDIDNNGFITSDELALVMKTYGGRSYTKKEIDDMIKQTDVDADGKVSYNGTLFKKSLSSNFGLSSTLIQLTAILSYLLELNGRLYPEHVENVQNS